MEQSKDKQGKPKSQSGPPSGKGPKYQAASKPQVHVLEIKKKKKDGSSKASRRLEEIESRASRSLHRRVTKAVNKGVTTYIAKRKKSARKRRDGALVDFYQNAATGVSKALAKSSPVLTDVAKALNTKRLRKRIRRSVRGIPVLW